MPVLSTYGAMAARAWRPGAQHPIRRLLAAGGASGGSTVSASTGLGGRGGAGEFYEDEKVLDPGVYPLVIGVAGAARAMGNFSGNPGTNTTGFGKILKGGGGGGSALSNGLPGGSGGGGGGREAAGADYNTVGGASTAADGLGFPGGNGQGGAGGGGSGGGGGAGGSPIPLINGTSGAGIVSDITGVAVEYCKGGGTPSQTPGSGGSGGASGGSASQAGRDGIALFWYPGPPRATGGTITSVAGGTLHTFTASGNFTVLHR